VLDAAAWGALGGPLAGGWSGGQARNLCTQGSASKLYSAEGQQRAIPTTSQADRQHTEQARTTAKRTALPLVREEEAALNDHAEYVPNSSLMPESPLVSKVQVQVLKTAARWPDASKRC
jgi:hypothetical protein